MKSTSKTGLICCGNRASSNASEVIKENEIVDLNILFLNLSNIFKVSQSLATNVS